VFEATYITGEERPQRAEGQIRFVQKTTHAARHDYKHKNRDGRPLVLLLMDE
jgi:hypothetical protein